MASACSLGNGPIEIGGSLVRVPGPNLQLDGTLLIGTGRSASSALGSYVDLNGTVSVMAFAVLLKELETRQGRAPSLSQAWRLGLA